MRRWFDDLPLATKLRLIILSAAVAAVLVASSVKLIVDTLILRHDLAENILNLATTFGENAAGALTAADRPMARNLLSTLRADPNIRAVTIYDAKGKLFVDVPLVLGAPSPEERMQAWAINDPAHDKRAILYRGLTLVHAEAPVTLDGDQIGTIHVDAELVEVYAHLRVTLATILAALALALLATHVLSKRLQRVVTTPVKALLDVTRQVREGRNFAVRGVASSGDEFGALTTGINGILAELEKREMNLQAYQNELEARVKERTVRLDAAVMDAQETLERAEAASRAKSEFLARMSHEIRTPMNAVLGMTELLRHATKLDERQRRYADTIHQSGSALLGLINDILDFSKIEAGKLELDIAPFSLREVVEDAVDILAEKAHGKGLELLCDIAPDVETAVCGDGQRLRQIIINLVGNAVKFTDRGEVRIVVRHLEFDRKQSTFRFEVVDTGVGIKPENCSTIFESFAQEDNSTTRKYGGTGLGLAICRQLVELMGGQIGVTSTPGVGSTFFFTVVLANDPATVRGMRPAVLKRTRVLVVDDNAMSREIVTGHLRSWGVAVTEAKSGQAALDILGPEDRGDFDALILDGQMPKMDGFALAKLIRARPGFADIPILMMASVSAAPRADDMVDDRTGWLSKPVRRSQLHSSLASLMASHPEPVTGATATISKRLPAIVKAPREKSRIKSVLLVEDNPVNQELALAMLRELGVQAVSAWSGEEALVKLAAEHFEVVLMDCQMPKLDGYATTRRLREWERRTGREHTPVIALTANALNGDASRCFEAGMDRYLSKPFTIEQLFCILESCVPHSADGGSAAPAVTADADAAARGADAGASASEPTPDTGADRGARSADLGANAADRRANTADRRANVADRGANVADREANVAGREANVAGRGSEVAGRGSDVAGQGVDAADRSAAAGEPDAAVLDERTLERIRDLHRRGGPNLLGKMAELYLSSSRALIDDARAALASGDASGVAQALHALKSSSGSIGATLLADLCERLEAAGRHSDLDGAESHFEAVVVEHARVVRALDTLSAAA
jgi:signal transduction histidine kinase/DNA-binding response OmpR family regulator/HPt (histidine-containing phosphotransfer) domain-containing protein